MTALPDRYEHESTSRLELRALEKMVVALCRDVDRLEREARARGALETREAGLQSEAFAERREQAIALLEDATSETREIRITRLEKMVEALRRSREYFLSAD